MGCSKKVSFRLFLEIHLSHFYIVSHCYILHIFIFVNCYTPVIFSYVTITICMWSLTRAEIFVVMWICRQFIWGKDWNWQWGCLGVSTINITEHHLSMYIDMRVWSQMFAVNVHTTAAELIHFDTMSCTAVYILNFSVIVNMLWSSSKIVLSFSDV